MAVKTEANEPETVDIQKTFNNLSTSESGLSTQEAKKRLDQWGPNAIEEKKTNPLLKALGYFWGPIPWMIEAAAILSLAIDHIADFVLITVLLIFNAMVAFFQEYQAGNAVEALKKRLALTCRTLRDGKWSETEAKTLVPGDVIRLRLGDIVPADAIAFEGDYLSIDQSALTGESLAVDKKIGEEVYSGTIIQKGEMLAVVTKTGKNTFFGKTAKLVEQAQPVSHFQKAVMTIGNFLIYMCLILVAVIVVVQLARGTSFFELLKFALILTVASIPVAMPAVLSVSMAVGALALAKLKAIVTRLESIEEMAGVDRLCSDKTGTLTYNKMTVAEPKPYGSATAQELILNAALASREEDMDPIDQAIIQALDDPAILKKFKQNKFTPFDPVIKRTEAAITASDGASFFVSKGAAQVLLEMSQHDEAFKEEVQKGVDAFARKGHRTLAVARSADGKNWTFQGLIPLHDAVREESKQTIHEANEHGIEVKMVTGDNLAIAKEVAREIGIGQNIYDSKNLQKQIDAGEDISDKIEEANGFAQVFPETKHAIVKSLQAKGHIVGMTGDGVNDSPALKQAELGIAVSNATDAARSAASLVLTAPGLSVIIGAIEEARRIFERMNTYAIYRITETIRIMFFMVLAMIIYDMYPITAMMLILLALMNDIPIMTIAYDNTRLPPKPVRWNMRRVITTASILGAIGVFETMLLMVIADSWLGVSTEVLQSIIFLKLMIAGHMTLLVVRSRFGFWTDPKPAPILLFAIILTQLTATLIVGLGVFVTAVPWSLVGLIWLYCFFWMFVEDRAKVMVYNKFDGGN